VVSLRIGEALPLQQVLESTLADTIQRAFVPFGLVRLASISSRTVSMAFDSVDVENPRLGR